MHLQNKWYVVVARLVGRAHTGSKIQKLAVGLHIDDAKQGTILTVVVGQAFVEIPFRKLVRIEHRAIRPNYPEHNDIVEILVCSVIDHRQ